MEGMEGTTATEALAAAGALPINESEMGIGLAIAMVGAVLLPLLLPILVGLALPGRKGRMMTSAEADWKGYTVATAFDRLRARLNAERFVPTAPKGRKMKAAHAEAQKAQRLPVYAERPKALAVALTGSLAIHTHATKPLNVDLEISSHVAGAMVRATIWTPDYVFLDTGEGSHIDQVLDRLLTPSNDIPAAEPVKNLPYSAMVCLTVGVLLCLMPLLMVALDWSPSRCLGLAMGSLMGAFIGGVLALLAVKDLVFKPREMRGWAWVGAGALLVALGIASSLGTAYHRHRDHWGKESFAEFFQGVMDHKPYPSKDNARRRGGNRDAQ